jgi:hypothetical protein
MARQGYLSLRLSAPERARFQALADRRGVSLAEWVRDAAVRRAEVEEARVEVEEGRPKRAVHRTTKR